MPANCIGAPLRGSGALRSTVTGFLINLEDYAGHTVYSKNGQTAGFAAQILFTTTPPRAVVLLANSSELIDNGALRQLGLAILNELL